ncbi:MAG TPA: metal-dependent hydrolase [Gaiellaceae bacterium]|jgi:L-ascorbate metabolism protein UlaG (beta-lactamase superfamily)|nr:metal-dependent hydrolase [Gaiellaceae bacterium]
MPDVAFTWLGHGSYRLDSPGGKRIYFDPWLENPKCPESEREPERADVMVLSHGHSDHVGSAVELGRRHSPAVVAIFELANWLEAQGVENATAHGMNKGGTVEVEGIKFHMTHALHSGGLIANGDNITYLGDAAGYVIEFENGTSVYAAGDTALFGDMELIGRHLEPEVAILPIGDHFTMGPRQAAAALELLGCRRCIPVHWGTFPLLTGTPEQLREHATGVEVLSPEPGETVTV